MRETTDAPDVLSGVDALLKINADDQLRERIFDREKALRDYGNDIAVAESRGRDVGRAEGRSEGRIERDNEIVKNMRKCGFTEAQIQMALGAA